VLNQTVKKSDNTVDTSYTSVSAAYTMGATTVMAQAGAFKNGAGLKADLLGLGADYALSKRTVAGVAYRKVDAATDVRQVGVGITHSF
jgi:predicted porin